MEFDKAKEKFGTWANSFRPFIESVEFDKIFGFLKTEAMKKKVICPVSKDIFRSFACCDKDKMKALVLLQDPYPTFRNEVMIADGIPLSCSYTKYAQPSLYMWYNQIEHEYGFDPANDQRNDLSYLLEEENVMLLNCGLSCEKDKSGSHNTIWTEFIKYFFKIINEEHRGLPIVLCGNSAQRYEKEINPLLHYIKKVEHPVAASYQNRDWKGEGLFKWINSIIEQNNGIGSCIRWTRKKNEVRDEDNKALQSWLGTSGDIPKAQELGLPWRED